jgi:hypothetical protein
MNPPKHIPKTPESTFRFDLDLIFQGHIVRQSSQKAHFQKITKICYITDIDLIIFDIVVHILYFEMV